MAGSDHVLRADPQWPTLYLFLESFQIGELSDRAKPESSNSTANNVRKELFVDNPSDENEKATDEATYVEDFPPLGNSISTSSKTQADIGNGAGSDWIDPRPPVPVRTNAWTNRSFLAVNRIRRTDNPYLEDVDPEWGKQVPDEKVHKALAELARINPPGDLEGAKYVQWNDEDTATTKIRYDQLRKAAVIANTPESTPTRDEMDRWMHNPEISKLHPMLEHLGNRMLSELVQPTYKTVTKGLNRYVNMRGCVMMTENSDRPSKLVFQLPWGGEAVQDIKYQDLPNTCFKCRRPGHQARSCPSHQDDRVSKAPKDNGDQGSGSETNEAGNATIEATNASPFIPVRHRSGRGQVTEKVTTPTPVNNQNSFDALNTEEDEPEDGSDNSQLQIVVSEPQAVQKEIPTAKPQGAIIDSQPPSEDNLPDPSLFHDSMIVPYVANLGDWAEVSDEYMVEAGPRGTKGRIQADTDHTPERGNVTKRRLTDPRSSNDDPPGSLVPPSGTQPYNVTAVGKSKVRGDAPQIEPDPGERLRDLAQQIRIPQPESSTSWKIGL
ncbi:hypothetical protein R1sor_007851 [Riccia sorocarpa]|uniref:CCHC-type domain-containing protein n=1 Tax=Riccia sorocarpa TaxID=122646 RepID=A0ABD3HRN7_9MARC